MVFIINGRVVGDLLIFFDVVLKRLIFIFSIIII